jgi:hypothetical protein
MIRNAVSGILLISLTAISLTSCVASHSLSRAGPSAPNACTQASISTNQNNLVIAAHYTDTQPRLYLLHNVSNTQLILNHESGHHASAGWGSLISAGHWSAILMNEPNFTLSCTALSQDKSQVLNCATVVTACELQHVEISARNMGHGWVTEDQTSEQLVPAIEKRGFKLQ